MASNTVLTSARGATNRRTNEYERQGTSEFAGVYLNPGVWLGETDDDGNVIEGTRHFARTNKGVAIEDLLVQTVYENTNDERKAEIAAINPIVEALREKAKDMAEGEMIPVKLELVLYKRQEGSEVGATMSAKDKDAVRAALFG